MGLTEAAAVAGHPYVPTSLELPGFHPATMSVESILGSFAGGVALVVLVVWLTSGRVAKLTTADRILMCWFAISGLTHLTLEFYFVLTPDFYTSDKPNLLAEVFKFLISGALSHILMQKGKEYSKADSRIAGRDPTVLVIEVIDVFIAGPGCLLAVYAIGAKAAYEHSTQLVVSTLLVCTTAIYFLTVAFAGIEFCLPHPLYFWFYFICMNGIWLVVPFFVACRSWRAINAIFASAKKKTA